MNYDENLRQAVATWRRGVKSTQTETGEVRPKNPYGQRIYDLNMQWAETKAALEDAYNTYRAELDDLLAKSKSWKVEYEIPLKRRDRRGRPKNPDYSDEVKIAAAELFNHTGNRTPVRLALGTSDTQRVTRTIEEGKALLEAQNNTEEDEW